MLHLRAMFKTRSLEPAFQGYLLRSYRTHHLSPFPFNEIVVVQMEITLITSTLLMLNDLHNPVARRSQNCIPFFGKCVHFPPKAVFVHHALSEKGLQARL